jgi:3-(3-hydroxy-phenyl)propionate hydroxylase
VHGRVIFAGDSAHLVSPFGARGGNGGIQDVDNLGWKLAAVLKGQADESLLATYDEERIRGADENIVNSARATNFMTPKSPIERIFRDEVLDLAAEFPFARRLVNSGRLSLPCSLDGLSLQTPCNEAALRPGSPCPDAPLERDGSPCWLLNLLGGDVTLLSVGGRRTPEIAGIRGLHIATDGAGPLQDVGGYAAERYGTGFAYLIRPDQHVAAAFREADAEAVLAARDKALGRMETADA